VKLSSPSGSRVKPGIVVLVDNLLHVNKNPTDATVCTYLFTVKLVYMFRVSQHPSSGVLKLYPQPPVQVILLVPEAAGTILILLMMGAVTPETCRVVLQ